MRPSLGEAVPEGMQVEDSGGAGDGERCGGADGEIGSVGGEGGDAAKLATRLLNTLVVNGAVAGFASKPAPPSKSVPLFVGPLLSETPAPTVVRPSP